MMTEGNEGIAKIYAVIQENRAKTNQPFCLIAGKTLIESCMSYKLNIPDRTDGYMKATIICRIPAYIDLSDIETEEITCRYIEYDKIGDIVRDEFAELEDVEEEDWDK